MLGGQYKLGGKLNMEHHSQITYLALSETGKVHTNRGSGGEIRLWLPEKAPMGTEYAFTLVEAFNLNIDPQSNTIFADDSAVANKYYGANVIGSTLRVCADENGDWIVISKSGTWTRET